MVISRWARSRIGVGPGWRLSTRSRAASAARCVASCALCWSAWGPCCTGPPASKSTAAELSRVASPPRTATTAHASVGAPVTYSCIVAGDMAAGGAQSGRGHNLSAFWRSTWLLPHGSAGSNVWRSLSLMMLPHCSRHRATGVGVGRVHPAPRRRCSISLAAWRPPSRACCKLVAIERYAVSTA